MSILTRYLIKRNLFLLGMLLLTGLGIYLLTDIFERMDNFMSAGLSFSTAAKFFALKAPVIVSQILPAVFLLSLVVQFCVMAKNREMTALQAGGVSPFIFLRFVIVYGLIWFIIELGFAQGIGVICERASQTIWQEEVQGHGSDTQIEGLWFTEENYVVHMKKLYSQSGLGNGLNVYILADDGIAIEKIITAETFSIYDQEAAKEKPHEKMKRKWTAYSGSTVDVKTFAYAKFDLMELPLRQNMSLYIEARRYGSSGEYLSLTALSKSIKALELSGSNVEDMRTKFHARISYAASLLVMAVLSLAITQLSTNLYIASSLSLLATFSFYAAFTFCTTLGSKGYMHPIMGAWAANILFFSLAVAFILQKALLSYRAQLGNQKKLTIQ